MDDGRWTMDDRSKLIFGWSLIVHRPSSTMGHFDDQQKTSIVGATLCGRPAGVPPNHAGKPAERHHRGRPTIPCPLDNRMTLVSAQPGDATPPTLNRSER